MKRFKKLTGYLLSSVLVVSLMTGGSVNAENIDAENADVDTVMVSEENSSGDTDYEDGSTDEIVDETPILDSEFLAATNTTLAVNPSGWEFSPSRPAYIPINYYVEGTANRVEPYMYRLGGKTTVANYQYTNREYFDIITVGANTYTSGRTIDFIFYQRESDGSPVINTKLNYKSYSISSDNVTAADGTYSTGSASKFPTITATNNISKPNSAWRNVKIGNYEIKMTKMDIGSSAENIVSRYSEGYRYFDNSNFRWVVMQFSITNNSSSTVKASDIIESTNGNCMLMKTGYTANPIKMANFRNNTYMSPENVSISSGRTAQVTVGALIPKDVNYPMIKVKSGSGYAYLYTYPSYMDVVNKITGINFDNTSITIGVGKTGGNPYTITPANAEYTTLAWSSSNTAVATVSSSGAVTGVKEGTATITAKAQDGGNYSKSYTVTVKSSTPKSITITDPSSVHYVSKYYELKATVSPETATNKEVTWSCNSSSVRFLTTGSPSFTAIYPGTYTITATSKVDSSVKATYNVTFKQEYTTTIDMPKSVEIERGDIYQIPVTVSPENAKNYGYELTTSNKDVVSVIAPSIYGQNEGKATITYTVKDGSGVYATCEVTVKPAKVKTLNLQSVASIDLGETAKLSTVVLPTFAINKDLTWSSSNTSVATVDSNGNVTGKAAGTAVITAKNAYSGITETCTVTVNNKIHPYLTGGNLNVTKNDKLNGLSATFDVTVNGSSNRVEKKWYALRDGETEEKSFSVYGGDLANWKPDKYGIYTIYATAKIINVDNTTIKSNNSITYEYHPHIKGICQIPYTGPGGGYLIGIESYDNPNGEYSYELLVYNCSTGLWEFRSTPMKPGGNCLWTVWQPIYGYFWTLFRIYDKDGNIIDEMCYGFANVC